MFCRAPFDNMGVFSNFYTTCCGNFLEDEAKVFDAVSPAEAWNHPRVQELRRAILAGDFRYCQRCAFYQSHDPNLFASSIRPAPEPDCKVTMDRGPLTVSLATDNTCNLMCWTCRDNKPMTGSDPERTHAAVAAWIGTAERFILQLAGNPFASPLFRGILVGLTPEQVGKCKLVLCTNGLLLPDVVPRMKVQDSIVEISMSIDAASKEQYERVRYPGKWEQVIRALEFICDKMPGAVSQSISLCERQPSVKCPRSSSWASVTGRKRPCSWAFRKR